MGFSDDLSLNGAIVLLIIIAFVLGVYGLYAITTHEAQVVDEVHSAGDQAAELISPNTTEMEKINIIEDACRINIDRYTDIERCISENKERLMGAGDQ